MANLKEIRIRITSVGSTMQITSAMKMVSAAKLKRAQDAIIQMRPYSNKLTELLSRYPRSFIKSEKFNNIISNLNISQKDIRHQVLFDHKDLLDFY